MGTNYYLHYNFCDYCGRYDKLHIGKDSYGWCFALHVYPEKGINTLEDWVKLISTGKIYTEYGDEVNQVKLIDLIINKKHTESDENKDWYKENDAEPGPNNLARLKIDGVFCIGHGEGPWDYCIGDEDSW